MVAPSYKRRVVLKASFGGGIGVSALVAAGAFMPQAELNFWGLPLLIVAGALITWCMLPYRRMTELENSPDELWINAKNELVYAKKNHPLFSVPLSAIEKIFYTDRGNEYGICLKTAPHPAQKIRIHHINLDFNALRQTAIRKHGCDIFLPFFSKRTYDDLKEHL